LNAAKAPAKAETAFATKPIEAAKREEQAWCEQQSRKRLKRDMLARVVCKGEDSGLKKLTEKGRKRSKPGDAYNKATN
jgi:hypothetical protein